MVFHGKGSTNLSPAMSALETRVQNPDHENLTPTSIRRSLVSQIASLDCAPNYCGKASMLALNPSEAECSEKGSPSRCSG